MTYETEPGFGSGLRAELERKQGIEPRAEIEAPAEPVEVPLLEESAVVEELDFQAELEAALHRERHLREALQHQVETYERELAGTSPGVNQPPSRRSPGSRRRAPRPRNAR